MSPAMAGRFLTTGPPEKSPNKVLPEFLVWPLFISIDFCWKDWCWSWSSNTLATWCQKSTIFFFPKVDSLEKTLIPGKIEGRKRRGWQGRDGWLASLTQWMWVWASSRRWWRTGKPGMPQSMGLQRVIYDWATEHIDWLRRPRTLVGMWVGTVLWDWALNLWGLMPSSDTECQNWVQW